MNDVNPLNCGRAVKVAEDLYRCPRTQLRSGARLCLVCSEYTPITTPRSIEGPEPSKTDSTNALTGERCPICGRDKSAKGLPFNNQSLKLHIKYAHPTKPPP
jgi:hypothetical protein